MSQPRAPRPRRATAATAPARRLITTTFRVYSDQRDALQRTAIDRRVETGETGRPDSSAVLRTLLDQAGLRGGDGQ